MRRQKNDGNDAEAICTAARQPHIPLVPKKTVEQQDIQALHRARQRMVNHRTAVVSQIRGLLLDRGFAMAKSITRARRLIPEFLSDLKNDLTPLGLLGCGISHASSSPSPFRLFLSRRFSRVRSATTSCIKRRNEIAERIGCTRQWHEERRHRELEMARRSVIRCWVECEGPHLRIGNATNYLKLWIYLQLAARQNRTDARYRAVIMIVKPVVGPNHEIQPPEFPAQLLICFTQCPRHNCNSRMRNVSLSKLPKEWLAAPIHLPTLNRTNRWDVRRPPRTSSRTEAHSPASRPRPRSQQAIAFGSQYGPSAYRLCSVYIKNLNHTPPRAKPFFNRFSNQHLRRCRE